MTRARHTALCSAFVLIALTLSTVPGGAHKPITSPYTYNDDVFPILRERCGRCHVPEGVAPMSLMTYDDTVPWGESIRVELLAGHMPPWNVDAAPTRFRNAQTISPREMNVLLTWATGGTPFGSPDKTPPPVARDRKWPLGMPDVELPLPKEFTLPADKQEDVAEFVVPSGFTERRWLRAVDLAPGTAAIVRSATVQIKSTPDGSQPLASESALALWLPGDDPISPDGGAAFEVPSGAELSVRVRYKKTWQYERKELRDRSTLGLYFAKDASQAIRAIALTADGAAPPANGSRKQLSEPISENVRALAIYATEHPSDARVIVTAVAPGGTRRELIAYHPQREWTRRFWFKDPIALERGTRFETAITADDETAAALPISQTLTRPRDSSDVRLTLDVISGER